ncbi:MAG: nicotinate (nicotinamide) nucleotide adenylyltransferase [Rhodothermales bacterium]
MSARRHIGLFGGAFNPPHLGHLIVAETLREQFDLDRVWWMPTATPPHKSAAHLAPAEHRVAMVEAAIASNPHFVCATHELDRGGVSYTAHTVAALREQYPVDRFSLLVGGDSYASFHTWYKPETILAHVDVLVYLRPEASQPPVPEAWHEKIRFATAPLIELSSTALRLRCAAGQSIRYRVPEAVRAYIQQHHLYTAS